MKRLAWSVLVSLSLASPALVRAADAYVVDNVNMRAGPDIGYPLVDQLPTGTEVDVRGCTDGWEWCDVIADGNRGWVDGNYLQYEYEDRPVLLPAYGEEIGIPIVSFAIGAYWGDYYRDRPFYRDRDHWYHHPIERRPPPRPPHYPHEGPEPHGYPGSGYQRPGHLGPVTPGRPVEHGQPMPSRGGYQGNHEPVMQQPMRGEPGRPQPMPSRGTYQGNHEPVMQQPMRGEPGRPQPMRAPMPMHPAPSYGGAPQARPMQAHPPAQPHPQGRPPEKMDDHNDHGH